MNKKALLALFCIAAALGAGAQRTEPVPFGDFEQWLNRDIKESAILGGNTKRVYAIAANGTQAGAMPYSQGASPWTSSNVYAVVMGITKTSTTVFPEERSAGNRCARMESMMVQCKVLGIVDITLAVAGSIYLGQTIEPIKDADNPYGKLNMGIPFSRRPSALVYDYSVARSTDPHLTVAKGLGQKKIEGKDCPMVFVLLQHRTEHPDGTITAKRIGTAKEFLWNNTNGWKSNHRMPIHYDVGAGQTAMPLTYTYYAKNSKGKMVRVVENEWGDETTPVTHVVLFMSSGHKEAFTAAIGTVFKVDNVRWEFPN